MSEKLTKIDASPEAKGLEKDLRSDSPRTAEEFAVLLSRYEKSNPEKYQAKLLAGSFTRQAKELGFVWPPVEEVKPKKSKE